jgi:DNA-binding HxlR family transcriptional regulator
MLTSTLRTLERDGLVRRVVHPTRPPKVEYSLTELGGTLVGHIVAFKQWADDHVPQILAAREAYDAAESRARGGPPPS